MPATNCKQCGGTVAPDADKCPHCGTENFDDNPIKMILKLAYIGLGLYRSIHSLGAGRGGAGHGGVFEIGWVTGKGRVLSL